VPIALVIGHDSELGRLASNHLNEIGWQVIGTSRRIESLIPKEVYYADLGDRKSISNACHEIGRDFPKLDLVIMSVGQLSPVGHISLAQFDEWANSVDLNFVNQVYFIREILGFLNNKGHTGTKFLSFAGSGTNSAPLNFSAYTLSKIALIKSMELFAAEYLDYFFISLGTGWMKSAIHDQTLNAGSLAGAAYSETLRRMRDNDFGSPQLFCDFLDWYIGITGENISGRNIALQGDNWKHKQFSKVLTSSSDAFKLRRFKD
jgi:NAD(P)-dependent dehydrogenase (short-subunit alcohol dehydrogenase family)